MWRINYSSIFFSLSILIFIFYSFLIELLLSPWSIKIVVLYRLILIVLLIIFFLTALEDLLVDQSFSSNFSEDVSLEGMAFKYTLITLVFYISIISLFDLMILNSKLFQLFGSLLFELFLFRRWNIGFGMLKVSKFRNIFNFSSSKFQ